MLSEQEIEKIVDEHTTDDHGYDIWCDGKGVARAIIAAHTAKLLAGVEIPEPTIIKDMDWCENEVYDIGDLQQYAAAAAAQARMKALEDVGALATVGATYEEVMLYLQSEIESLKGKQA